MYVFYKEGKLISKLKTHSFLLSHAFNIKINVNFIKLFLHFGSLLHKSNFKFCGKLS
jgi:hypothetical protein